MRFLSCNMFLEADPTPVSLSQFRASQVAYKSDRREQCDGIDAILEPPLASETVILICGSVVAYSRSIDCDWI